MKTKVAFRLQGLFIGIKVVQRRVAGTWLLTHSIFAMTRETVVTRLWYYDAK